MIVGTPQTFAVESVIAEVNPSPSLRGLGYFRIHLAGEAYGRCERDSTFLANSYDAVLERLAHRGAHTLPLFEGVAAPAVADAVRTAIYGDVAPTWSFSGVHREDLARAIHASRIVWAPDGDAAFDDRSSVLQLDVNGEVRVIGFRVGDEGTVVPSTVREVRLSATDFYEVLERWSVEFLEAWRAEA